MAVDTKRNGQAQPADRNRGKIFLVEFLRMQSAEIFFLF